MAMFIIDIYIQAVLITDLTANVPPQPINTLKELANTVSIFNCIFVSDKHFKSSVSSYLN